MDREILDALNAIAKQNASPITPTELKFLLWAIGILMSVIAFILVLFVKYFVKLVGDVGDIKRDIQIAITKHNGLESTLEEFKKETREELRLVKLKIFK